jgi:ATP-dependent exoDNAse (exonuclease V) beta subunit
MIEDLDVRIRAIDPADSFIVQAPAGSGKTELLMQRILTLLLTVQEPEEVMALTFTKKAVEEMRHRVISTLLATHNNTPITSEHQRQSRALAQAVLEHDQKHQWHLLDSPQRLNISTIDALCLKICQGSPQETLLPLDISPLDNAIEVYKKSIQTIFNSSQQHYLYSELQTLLLHCDNQYPTIERLLCQLIAQREQWLPLVMPYYHQPDQLKHACEQVIENILQSHLNKIIDNLPEEFIMPLWQSTVFSKQQCNPNTDWDPMHCQLEQDADSFSAWLYVANLLLTKDGNWRSTRSINKTLGFTKETPEEKKACQNLLETLSQLDNQETLRESLAALRTCPELHYNEDSWEILKACLMCLPDLVAQCHLNFQAIGQCDYVELNLAACRVLDHEAASQKALILNHKISHILVDECQDTSLSQARLLLLLTQHWDSSEHKTLFFVGDPMQSIYRFRQAEVSLFHQWQMHGLGHIALTPLQLTSNFRSDKAVVEWFNNQFINIFPHDYSAQNGGIPYAMATAIKEGNSTSATKALIIPDGSAEDEAAAIIQSIQALEDKNKTIAILLQRRSQALPLIQALKKHQLAFEASDIEPLINNALTLDWLTCLRALCNFDDSIAWIALLRSPICGAKLETLFNLTQASQDKSLLNSILDKNPENPQKYLHHFQKRLANLFEHSIDQPLWQLIDTAWQTLGFQDFYEQPSELIIYEQCQNLLKYLNWHRHTFDCDQLMESLEKTYCESELSAAIKIMTIHKSKGLEFDTVIIPGLQIKPRPEDKSLITWQTILLEDQAPQFCIAPLASKEQKKDKVYDYCRLIEKLKLAEERKRLLYVACTRAKSQLILSCALPQNEDSGNIAEQFNPNRGSFAQMLWLFLCQHATIIEPAASEKITTYVLPNLMQPTQVWLDKQNNTTAKNNIKHNPPSCNQVNPQLEQFIHQTQAQTFGDALHKLCETLHQYGLDHNYENIIDNISEQYASQINSKENITDKLNLALHTMQQDSKAQWIFSNHQDTHSEWVILEKLDYSVKKHIIDYSFIDNGTRWIIDFKSASPAENESPQQFLKNQKEDYAKQLDRYTTILKQAGETLPIQCALYFPMCGLWAEVVTA